ncbi:hypothetical protein [Shewanella phaeophyticola]|uniref:Lipoprotein n=1 Tax=Shewanella phaeophyticola TaxID=2978345 RepID=A0ABT2NZX8_9GAMM|nr:hypothetical protein [Shewanella sp. KJ10-1]MCT8985951.1 hypothetical protein [Shewanella sp. KJ10-1]
MKCWTVILLLFFCTSCLAKDKSIEECGIDIHKSFEGKDNNFIELLITVEPIKRQQTCERVETVSVSNYIDSEWVMFPLSKEKSTLSLRFNVKTANKTAIYFMLSHKNGDHLFFDDSNNIKVNLSDLL